MSKRRRRGRGFHEPTENHERWLITYADLITLLMIFFVVMYAMSKVDQSKFDSLSVSLQQVFQPSTKVPIEEVGGSAIISKQPEENERAQNSEQSRAEQEKILQQALQEKQMFDDMKRKLEQFVTTNQLGGKVNVIATDRGVQITLNDAALFDSGKAELKEGALKVLGGMAPFLGIVSNKIAVEGHTDNQPIVSSPFPSNWELSAQRAVNVVKFFEQAGIQHERLQAIGFADTVPLAANDTPDNRSSNRRVNLIVQREHPMPSINPLNQENIIR